MATVNLSFLDIATNIGGDGWWPFSDGTTRSLSYFSNVIGICPGLPTFTSDVTSTNIQTSHLNPIIYNANGTAYPGSFGGVRRMSSDGWNLGNINNMFFIVFAGSYRVINWCDSTTIYKNGSSISTPTTAGTVTNIGTLAIGDRIEASKPFSLYYNGLPGLYGAYAGFSGYSFATRNDRESTTNGNKFYVFCTDSSAGNDYNSFVQIRHTTTSNSNVTSLSTADLDDEWGDVYEYYDINMTDNDGGYFAVSSAMMCAWRGRPTSTALYDSVPMFPLTPEPKYGWYSTGGHILAGAGPYQFRDGTTSNYSIRTRTNSTTTTEFSLSTGVERWARNDSNTGANTTSKFAGSPAVTYPSVTGSNAQGALFAAESQGDGDGTEMTPHVGVRAAGPFHCNPGGGNWQAHIAHGTGSEGAAVVQRFNSDREFVESFSVGNSSNGYTNTTAHPWASCRFTFLNAGDVFVSTGANNGGGSTMAWADMDSSDDDETYLVAGDDMDGFSFTTYEMYYDEEETSGLATSALNACNLEEVSTIVYSPSTSVQVGMVIYLQNSNILSPLVTFGGGLGRAEGGFARIVQGRTSTAVEFEDTANGRIKSVSTCISDRRLKKNITKVGTSPSGINIYKFEYIDSKLYGGGVFEGVMAQEVPKASILGKNGYYSVDYSKLDVTFKQINDSLVG